MPSGECRLGGVSRSNQSIDNLGNVVKFIHLTDPHMVVRPKRLFDLDLHARLAAAVTSINAHHPDAQFCMVTGDLTHWGEPDAYAEFREILDDLPFPWHPLLGNHDVRTASREALADFTKPKIG